MDKKTFLAQLRCQLSGIPQDDIEDRLIFYTEIIDDMLEEGISEEEAVSKLGTPEQIASKIIGETPLKKLVKERIKKKKNVNTWQIVLLSLGSPIWLSLLVAAFAILISLYAVVWSVVISLWSVFASFAACALAGGAVGIVYMFNGNFLTGVAIIGASMVLAGLSVLMFYACVGATKGCAVLTKKILLGIKKMFAGKERK